MTRDDSPNLVFIKAKLIDSSGSIFYDADDMKRLEEKIDQILELLEALG